MTPRIQRVKSITLQSFRGFVGSKEVNTDADVVLITGPNGFGKTSLIDALCLLLTGHSYSEREPLLCTLGGSTVRSTELVAEVMLSDGRRDQVSARLSRSPRQKTEVAWKSSHSSDASNLDRALVARASFFYQDVLKYLFEEESAEVAIEDFLVAGSSSVQKIRDAVRHGVQVVMYRQRDMRPAGDTLTEHEIAERRLKVAEAFTAAWLKAQEWEAVRSIGIQLPQFTDSLLKTRPRGLRTGWQRELSDLARECLQLLPNTRFPQEWIRDSETIPALQALKLVCTEINGRIDAHCKKGSDWRDVLSRFNAAQQDAVLLTEEEINTEETKIRQFEEEQQQVGKMLRDLQTLERHFQNRTGYGPSLVDVLAAIRENAERWLTPPRIAYEVYEPPKRVLNWLRNALSSLDTGEIPVDVQMSKWVQYVTDQRVEVGNRSQQLAETIRQARTSVQLSRYILELCATSPELRKAVSDILARGQTRATVGDLLGSSRSWSGPSHGAKEHESPIAVLIRYIDDWIAVEKDELKRQEAAKRSASYRAVEKELSDIEAALNAELQRDSSILTSLELVPRGLRDQFAVSINYMLSRFHLVEGISPIEITPSKGKTKALWEIKTKDGRNLSCLSSGQKAQLAISLVIALNAALREHIWHNVLAFDDFTSSLDMSQLPRLATLLRQIAYGSGLAAPTANPILRRQVFLVSHHEDLTNRLLDFMIPPEGHSMRILNFVGWTHNEGPRIEELDVVPGARASAVADELAALLYEGLARTFR